MRRRGYSDEDLITKLKIKAKQLGRTPVVRDIDSDNSMPTHKTYQHRFGSWDKALEAAGLSPNRRGRKKKS